MLEKEWANNEIQKHSVNQFLLSIKGDLISLNSWNENMENSFGEDKRYMQDDWMN